MGHIYKRGQTYWIKYFKDGKPYYESSRSHKEADAKRLLKRREGDISKGRTPGIQIDRVRFDDLADDFITDYRINHRKSLVRAERSVGHLKRFFEGMRVPDITSPKIAAYIEQRIEEGAANATINRELSALKRAFNIGAKQTPPKVDRVPYMPMLKENNVRDGFFEHGEFIALRNALPTHLRGLQQQNVTARFITPRPKGITSGLCALLQRIPVINPSQLTVIVTFLPRKDVIRYPGTLG